MDLDEFSRLIQQMQERLADLTPNSSIPSTGLRAIWEETSEALGVSVEELRVADEELRQQNAELENSHRLIEEERRRYADLFAFAPDAYLVTDLFGMILEANRAAGELLGSSPYFLVGKPLANFVVMSERMAFRGGLNRLPKVGRREGWMVRLRPRTGPEFATAMTAAVVRDLDGTPTALRWLIREVREAGQASSSGAGRVTVGLDFDPSEGSVQHRAEDEAEALRGLIQGIDLIVWEAEAATGRYSFISPRAERVLGYPTNNWLEEPEFWSEIVHSEDRAMARVHRSRCLRDGKGCEQEYRLVAADGRVLWFRESISVESDAEGRARRLRGCLWEIGRRKKVERQLYTDRRKLAEHLADAWHLHLLGGQLLATIELGPIYEEILASTAAVQGAELALLHRHDAETGALEVVAAMGLPPESLVRLSQARGDDLLHGMAVRCGAPVAIENLDEEPAASGWVDHAGLGGVRALFIVPILNRQQELLGMITTFFPEPHRPSERQSQLMEQYLLQAADALENAIRHQEIREADRRKEEFLATLAHELRNPLAAIQTSAFLLEPKTVDRELVSEAREVIVRQVRHMARLVEDLLDVARISRGKLTLRRQRIDLAEMVSRAVDRGRPQAVERSHELTLALPGEPVMVEVDPTRFEQIITNLLVNATKYTDPGGRIEVAARREGDTAVIKVRDNGIGLSPEALNGLFELFRQVDSGHDRSRSGLGIGLALVKSLVELHGGTVVAQSDGSGRGSQFVVRLPVAAREAAASPRHR